MPSINRYLTIHADRRIRLNTCEGEVSITNEERVSGRWRPASSDHIFLTREQAQALIDQLADQMAKNF